MNTSRPSLWCNLQKALVTDRKARLFYSKRMDVRHDVSQIRFLKISEGSTVPSFLMGFCTAFFLSSALYFHYYAFISWLSTGTAVVSGSQEFLRPYNRFICLHRSRISGVKASFFILQVQFPPKVDGVLIRASKLSPK